MLVGIEGQAHSVPGLDAADAVDQRDDPVIAEVGMDVGFRPGDLGQRDHGVESRRPGAAAPLSPRVSRCGRMPTLIGAVGKPRMVRRGLEGDAARRGEAEPAFFTATTFSGGSEKVRAVRRSCGRR